MIIAVSFAGIDSFTSARSNYWFLYNSLTNHNSYAIIDVSQQGKEDAMHDISHYPEPIRRVLAAQFRLQHVFANQRQEWAELDLTMGQLKAVMILAGDQRVTISQLADMLHIGKPAASVLVDRLVHLGLVRRAEDENDRRHTLLTLTDTCRDLATQLRQGSLERMAQWFAAMAPDDLAALQRGLEALADAAEASDKEPQTHTSVETGASNGTIDHAQ
jgi:DNA-binding MarR family transcriptional regulator